MTIELAPEVEARLVTKAQQLGLKVGEYAQQVLQREVNGEQSQAAPSVALTEAAVVRHRAGVAALAGKYAGYGPTIEQRRQWKEEEIEIEEAKYRRRHPQPDGNSA